MHIMLLYVINVIFVIIMYTVLHNYKYIIKFILYNL